MNAIKGENLLKKAIIFAALVINQIQSLNHLEIKLSILSDKHNLLQRESL